MNIKEFGKEHKKTLLMIQGSCMNVDLWEGIVDELQKKFHILLPVIPGHDYENTRDFTTIDTVSQELEEDLHRLGIQKIDGAYGLSMGGSILIKLLDRGILSMDHVILDGAITPYHYPKLWCRLIGIRDYLMGKGFRMNKKLTLRWMKNYNYPMETAEKFFHALKYLSDSTLYNVFYHCNNYKMEHTPLEQKNIYYLYGEKEEKQRKKDLHNVKAYFPHIEFRKLEGLDHGQLSCVQKDEFCRIIKEYLQ